MDASKRKRLEEAGWGVGSVQDFLALSDEEAAAVERNAAGMEDPQSSERLPAE